MQQKLTKGPQKCSKSPIGQILQNIMIENAFLYVL